MNPFAFVLLVAATGLLVAGCDGDEDTSDHDGARPVTQFDGVPYGDTCTTDAACGGEANSCCTGGKCSPEGWCSPICTTDDECPDGFFCISHDGTRCFWGCVDDLDCPTNFICEDKDGHRTCRYK